MTFTFRSQRGSVVLIPEPELRHRWDHREPTDVRLAWTRCGIRFAWGGPIPPGTYVPKDCAVCWPS